MRTRTDWAKSYVVTITTFDPSAGAFLSVTDNFMPVGLEHFADLSRTRYWDVRSSNAKKIRLEWEAKLIYRRQVTCDATK